ncbi:MAG: alanyl-tRNA editing protein [Desulfurococcaceae archaeon]
MDTGSKLLYQTDSYLKEYEGEVVRASGDLLFFNATIFHPRSGGVECDKGLLTYNGERVEVVEVFFDKDSGDVAHKVSRQVNLTPGTRVKMFIDWERRYRLMRLHTAAHIISALMYTNYGALVSGGNISSDYAYDDYTLEKFDKDLFLSAIEEANRVAKRDLEVKIYWLPREQALNIPGVVKLATKMPPSVSVLRIVEIPGIDIQADGGPHVRRTSEIGEIVFIKAENRGKNKKRMYFTVK